MKTNSKLFEQVLFEKIEKMSVEQDLFGEDD